MVRGPGTQSAPLPRRGHSRPRARGRRMTSPSNGGKKAEKIAKGGAMAQTKAATYLTHQAAL